MSFKKHPNSSLSFQGKLLHMKGRLYLLKKLIILVVLFAVISIIFYRTGLSNTMTDIELLQVWFNELGFLGYFAFILLSIFITVFMLPGQFLAIIAGITYGGFLGGLLTVAGATIGSSISFAIGKYFARDLVSKKFENNPVFQKIEKGVQENGINFLILTRLVPVFPFAIQSYAYALTPMKISSFTIISAITMLPACFIYSFLASEIVTKGFTIDLLFEFTIAGIILFLLSFIPKIIAKRKKIELK